jgi:hypothetical protein
MADSGFSLSNPDIQWTDISQSYNDQQNNPYTGEGIPSWQNLLGGWDTPSNMMASLYGSMGLNTPGQMSQNKDEGMQYNFSGMPDLYRGYDDKLGLNFWGAFGPNGQVQGNPLAWQKESGMDTFMNGFLPLVMTAAGPISSGLSDWAAAANGVGDAMGNASGTLGAVDSQAYNYSLADGGLAQGPGTIPNMINGVPTGVGSYDHGMFGDFFSNPAVQSFGQDALKTGLNKVRPGLGNLYGIGSNAMSDGNGIFGTGLTGNDIFNGLSTLYGMRQNNVVHNNYVNNLSGMYGQDSPYAQMLRQQLERRDAAAGRRSQYGPREVELQAQLAQMNSRNAQPIYNAQMAQLGYGTRGLQQLVPLMQKAAPFLMNKIPGLAQLFGGGQGPQLNVGGFGSGMDYTGSTNPFGSLYSSGPEINPGSFGDNMNFGGSSDPFQDIQIPGG